MNVIYVLFHVGAILSAGWFGYGLGLNKGHRRGMRRAARICAESAVDPRPAFREWLERAGDAHERPAL